LNAPTWAILIPSQQSDFHDLHSGDRFGMVALTPEQQRDFIDEHPNMFTPDLPGWLGRVHLHQPRQN
jgi:hypothetical protein